MPGEHVPDLVPNDEPQPSASTRSSMPVLTTMIGLPIPIAIAVGAGSCSMYNSGPAAGQASSRTRSALVDGVVLAG
jgi:hypothetical protein